MFVGKVIGSVWSTVKWPELTGHKLLVVRPYHLAELKSRHEADAKQSPASAPLALDATPALSPAQFETVVCIDLLDAGIGDDVVVAFGHAARVAAESLSAADSATGTKTPIDAAIVAIIDSYSL